MYGNSSENDDIMEKLEFALNQLEEWQKEMLIYHIENNFEDRDKLLKEKVGIDYQVQRNQYINRLLNKVKELIVTGKYEEKHKGNSKPTLKGF